MDDIHSDQAVIVVPGNVPAFLLKLWNILENPTYDTLISWNQNGKTIKIHDQNEFASQILPRYYKHNNFSSFVRQVNMYGFRKVVDSESGGLKQEHPEWEFFHTNFQRGKPEELHLIKRKVNVKEEQRVGPQLTHLLLDVEKLKNQHTVVQDKLNLMKTENELLWREVSDLRDQHHSQQALISKLIQFIANVMVGKTDLGRKRKALDLPLPDSKIPRTQDVQLYNPQAAALAQIYQEPYNDLPSDRLVELPPDTIEIVEESNSPQFNEMSTMTPVSTSSILSPDSQENTSTQEVQPSFVYSVTTSSTVATPSLRTTPARIISIPNSSNQIQSKLPVRTTVTILPTPKKPKTTQSQNVTNIIKKTVTIKKSPFIFPKTFQEKPTNTIVNSLKKSEEMTTPTAEVPDELPIPEVAGYDVLCNGTCEKAGVPTFPSLVTDEKSSIEETDAPITVVPISVPVPASISAPVPVYNRQNSFRNRQEVSSDVEQISRKIDLLQELFDKQQINLDLKNLNQALTDRPSQVNIQELIRLIQLEGNNDEQAKETNGSDKTEVDGQLLPYTEPFSPSQYMDTQTFQDNTDDNELFETILSSE